jgi:hypothetical protein
MDSCAGCHANPRGSAGSGGAILFVRPDHRDAPHLFGVGIKEMLADEITADLRVIRDEAIFQARMQGRTVTRELRSKGIDYGRLTALSDGTVDTSQVQGVNPDLRVRPLFAEGSPCEDGDLCSVRDRCQAGRCQGQARVCDDGFAGTLDRCNTRTGECEHGASAGCCEPGEPCEVAARQREGRVQDRHQHGAQFPRPDAGARRGMRESTGNRVCRHARGDAAACSYPYVTEAPSGRLRALGDHAPFMPIEEAVRDFITHHLSQPDPYL